MQGQSLALHCTCSWCPGCYDGYLGVWFNHDVTSSCEVSRNLNEGYWSRFHCMFLCSIWCVYAGIQEFTWQVMTFYAEVCHRQRPQWLRGGGIWVDVSPVRFPSLRVVQDCYEDVKRLYIYWMIIWHYIQHMNTYMISDVLEVEEMTKKLVPGKLQIDGNFKHRWCWQSSPCILHWWDPFQGVGVSGLIMYLNKSWRSTDLIDSYWSMFD